MSASTPLFDAQIEPDEFEYEDMNQPSSNKQSQYPSGNIGSASSQPASTGQRPPEVLVPGPAQGIGGGNMNDAEMGIVS